MKYRVWCTEIESASEGQAIEARSSESAAYDRLLSIDAEGAAFPEDNDGDKCTIAVAEWTELGEEDNELDARVFVFKLVKERRVELQ